MLSAGRCHQHYCLVCDLISESSTTHHQMHSCQIARLPRSSHDVTEHHGLSRLRLGAMRCLPQQPYICQTQLYLQQRITKACPLSNNIPQINYMTTRVQDNIGCKHVYENYYLLEIDSKIAIILVYILEIM